jgi:hypothetical protein
MPVSASGASKASKVTTNSIGYDPLTSEMKLINWTERISFVCGVVLVLLTAPPVAIIIGSSVLWEAVDRGFKGGLVESGNELSGVLMGHFVPWVDRVTKGFNRRLVKREEDTFIVNAFWFYGLGMPLLLYLAGKYHTEGVYSPYLICYVYHVLRIGPFFMNFAYVYSLCHKEGHATSARSGLFAPPFDKKGPFRLFFNWWVGPFYGVLPASFAIGHSINHHRYNNGPMDVTTTSDKPRDSWMALIAYVPRMFLYVSNISTVRQFCAEGLYNVAFKTVLGSAWYFAWVALIAHFYSWPFALAYVGYPFLENLLLLSCINFVWHGFIDPENVENE